MMIALSPAPSLAANAPLFPTEQQAQQHCPNDTVVWLNTKTGVYHIKGSRWYGATKDGAYVCQHETSGRPALNGQ
ncbi:MAG: hypothetical protein ACRED7_12345 [Stellaceae bacterium]